MYTHKIEKALILTNARKTFPASHIDQLIRYAEKYYKNWDGQDTAFLAAFAALLKCRELSAAELEKISPGTSKRLEKFLSDYCNLNKKEVQSATRKYHYISAATKNKTIDYDFFVKSRHSIRNLTNRSVSREILDKAVEQARWTPSVCNRQAWRVHVFENENDKKRALINQNGNEGFGDKADKILLITCDLRYFVTSRERNQYFVDGGMFAMSLIYSLHAVGVASCALNLSIYGFQDLRLHRMLKIPMYETPIMMIAIGYPPDELEVTSSQRLPIEKLIKYRMD
jgi:nitroreductase